MADKFTDAVVCWWVREVMAYPPAPSINPNSPPLHNTESININLSPTDWQMAPPPTWSLQWL